MELFETAIAAERVAEGIYRQLATKFSHRPDIAEFWEAYAEAEAGHARTLQSLRDGLSMETLEKAVDAGMMNAAYRALQRGEKKIEIADLQEAYELASELESGETNAVFEFLITHFSEDKQAQIFLRSQLKSHVSQLMLQFPERFGDASIRKEIKIVS